MPDYPQPIEDGIYDMIPVEPGYGGGAGGYVPGGYVDPLPGWISPPGYGYDNFLDHIPNHEIHIIHHIEYPEHESFGHGHGQGFIQSLFSSWPENMVAAIAPAEWVSNNFQFSQITSDSNEYDDDYYDYYSFEEEDDDLDNFDNDDENDSGSEADESYEDVEQSNDDDDKEEDENGSGGEAEEDASSEDEDGMDDGEDEDDNENGNDVEQSNDQDDEDGEGNDDEDGEGNGNEEEE